ncbi:pyroglutamyl-peptidase I [Peribacillus alkalitolerans]|uniref:pyroglutamyl-peptidase I n=1 Tax=Peribacillus alkalitolerans TaxID=1550385 RepID=UPI0013D6103F|nr:pyroglutamyl-peptidase I [Peribacillus alkalitolerans]
MGNILITGFDPFGGEQTNPSIEAVKKLNEQVIKHHTVVARQLPTVFNESINTLKEYMDELKPFLVICVGQAGGRPDITFERIAINVNDARIPDNNGQQPIDTPIIQDGPVGYWSTLPIKSMVKNLRENGVPATISHTASTFVCNHIFYALLHILHGKGNAIRGGFIHIPFLPEQAAKHPGQPSMSLDTIVRGLELAIEAAVNHENDIVVVGGQTH